MKLCRVVGNVVASVKHPAYTGQRLLIVQPIDEAGSDAGASLLAVNTVQAGPGDRVLVLREGNGVRQILGMGANVPIRSLIVGIVDEVSFVIADRRLMAVVVDTSRALHARGWVANHDGNATVRLGGGRFLATPTATSKAQVSAGDLLVVDETGQRVAGNGRRFSELDLHLAVYERRDDVGAVLHAHPPYATAIACSGSEALARPFIAEAVVSLGASIPTVPFAMPGAAAVAALAPHAGEVNAVLIANHGVVTWAADLELAYLRMELVEHLARIAIAAQALGGVKPLPEAALAPLLDARAKAGLGKAAERAAAQRAVACAPAPHAPNVEIIADRPPSPDVERIVREEIARALRNER